MPRYTDRHVTFLHPFTLGTSIEVHAAGSYAVEIGEESYQGMEHTARVRTSTVLIIPTRSGTRHLNVSESDLDAALKTDADHRSEGAPDDSPDRGHVS